MTSGLETRGLKGTVNLPLVARLLEFNNRMCNVSLEVLSTSLMCAPSAPRNITSAKCVTHKNIIQRRVFS